jgi:hypothetical protein
VVGLRAGPKVGRHATLGTPSTTSQRTARRRRPRCSSDWPSRSARLRNQPGGPFARLDLGREPVIHTDIGRGFEVSFTERITVRPLFHEFGRWWRLLGTHQARRYIIDLGSEYHGHWRAWRSFHRARYPRTSSRATLIRCSAVSSKSQSWGGRTGAAANGAASTFATSCGSK